jgi:hypothetical protein
MRIDPAQNVQKVLDPTLGKSFVVTREFGGASHSQLLSERCERNMQTVIDDGYLGMFASILQIKGDGVALGGANGDANPHGRRKLDTVAPRRQNEGLSLDRPSIRLDRRDALTVAGKSPCLQTVMELDTCLTQDTLEGTTK